MSFRYNHSSEHDNCRRTLREVKQSGAGQVVVDCSYSNIRLVLKAAQAVREYYIMLRIYYEDHLKVGMMTASYSYLVTSLDLHTLDLEDFKHGGTNITAFSLLDPHNPRVRSVVRSWVLGEKRFPSRVSANPVPFIKVTVDILTFGLLS